MIAHASRPYAVSTYVYRGIKVMKDEYKSRYEAKTYVKVVKHGFPFCSFFGVPKFPNFSEEKIKFSA